VLWDSGSELGLRVDVRMRDAFDRSVLVRALRHDDGALLRQLIDELKASPTAAAILADLSRDREWPVRSWAAAIAAETVGRAALPWLLEMTQHDRNSNNRSLALQVLMDIDPEAGRPLIGKMRKQLLSKNDDQATDAARTLIELGDADSLPALRQLAARWEPGTYRRTRLEVWILPLEGHADEVVERIRRHDHVCLPWLAYAASHMPGTAEARSTLTWGSENLPDEHCRRVCAEELGTGRW
jgi:hypothetical protein